MSIISNEWKQALTIEDYQPFCETISLFDLAFYENSKNEVFINTKDKGLKLKHTVISYDSNDINNTKVAIAIPKVDLRSKPLFIHKNKIPFEYLDFENMIRSLALPAISEGDYYYTYQQSFSKPYSPGIKIFDKEAFLSLSDTDSFYSQEKNKDFYNLSYGPFIEDEEEHSDIILSQENSVFETNFLLKEEKYSHLKAFNSLYMDFNNPIFEIIFKRFWGIQGKFALLDYISSINDTQVEIDDLVKYMLKNTYINILAYFYADIIDYRDFGQKLTPDANVIHKNILVSSSANLKRFDEQSDDNIDSAKVTRPYIPTTTPLTDNYAKGATTLDIYNNAEKYGALQTETFENKEESLDEFFTSSAFSPIFPPFYFDKNSRNEASDYITPPILVPKDGNILLDGRVFSVTIDELWEAIKRIEFGRDADKNAKYKTDVGYPIGEDKYRSDNDTRPLNAKKFKVNENGNIGDPLQIEYEDSGKILSQNVKSWVNDPNKILYNFMIELKSLAASDFEDIDLNKDDKLELARDLLSKIDTIEEYVPSSNAYSLRELESILRGLEYNLAYVINYSRKYFARVGSIGKIINQGQYNENAGTAYQLHKDYFSGEDTTYKGTASLNPITPEMIGKNQDQVPSYSVFMSAAGTWQSVSQCMRVRIRNDEEF